MDEAFGPARYARYAQLRAAQPIVKVITPDHDITKSRPMWLVTRHDDVLQALRDPRLRLQPPAEMQRMVAAEGGPMAPRNLLNTDGDDHTRLRKAASGLFGRRRMEALRPAIQATTESLIDALPQHEPVDFIEHFALQLPLTVICQLMGIPEADHGLFRDWTKSIFDAEGDTMAGLGNLLRYMVGLIELKRAEPGDDLTTEFLASAADLNPQEVIGTLMLLLVAGHETTTNLIGNGLLALLLHPEEQAKLRTKPDLVPDAIEEFLRYDAPVAHGTIRHASEDIVIAGTTVPKGDQVILALGSANQDAELVGGHSELDVARAPSKHLAFGHGVHYCLGAPLARLEGQIAFGTLLRRLPEIELAVSAEELEWRISPLMRGLSTLPVRITKGS
jgi:cytochrome P450